MVQYLLDIGLKVNDREGCGLTALNLAVLQKNNSLVNVLVKSGAQHSGPLFTSVASPLLANGQNNEFDGSCSRF